MVQPRLVLNSQPCARTFQFHDHGYKPYNWLIYPISTPKIVFKIKGSALNLPIYGEKFKVLNRKELHSGYKRFGGPFYHPQNYKCGSMNLKCLFSVWNFGTCHEDGLYFFPLSRRRQGFCMYPWLSWNLLQRPDSPRTQRSACLWPPLCWDQWCAYMSTSIKSLASSLMSFFGRQSSKHSDGLEELQDLSYVPLLEKTLRSFFLLLILLCIFL